MSNLVGNPEDWFSCVAAHGVSGLIVLVAQVVEHTFWDRKVAGSYPRRAIPKASKMVPMSCLVLCILQQTLAFISHLLQIPKKVR